MATNSFVYTCTWNDRVRRYVAFYGEGIEAWQSDAIKPSCPVVAVRGTGPNAVDVIYVGSIDGWIYQLNFHDGTVLWQKALWNPAVTDPVRGITYSDGVLYCTAGNALYALNLDSGPLWKQDMGNLAWGAPGVANGIVYAGSWDGKLYAINVNGSVAWISEAGNFFASEPVISDGVVYARAFENLLLALNAVDGAILWQVEADDGFNFMGRVAVGNSTVYASTAGSSVYAFNVLNGTKIWKVSLPGHPNEPRFDEGRIFVSTEHGIADCFLYALQASNGNQIWDSPIPVGDGGDAISPAAIDKGSTPHNVFVTSQDQYIYAFAQSDGWFAWKAQIANSGQYPIEPTWSDDPLELPFKAMAPSRWLERMFVPRQPVLRTKPVQKKKGKLYPKK